MDDIYEQRQPAGKTFIRPKGLAGPGIEVAAANFNNPSMEPKGRLDLPCSMHSKYQPCQTAIERDGVIGTLSRLKFFLPSFFLLSNPISCGAIHYQTRTGTSSH